MGPSGGGGGRVLVCRLDSMGDVLLTGPAVRAVAAAADRVVMLVSSLGVSAARLLPGVDGIIVFDAPWVLGEPPPLDATAVAGLVAAVAAERPDRAIIHTSFHQSPLPLAMLLRMAGVPFIGAWSEDYPGSLLDVRLLPHDRTDGGPHEVERNLTLVAACGTPVSPIGDGPGEATRLRVRTGASPTDLPAGFVAVHGGSAVPARGLPSGLHRDVVGGLLAAGRPVVLTGHGRTEVDAASRLAGPGVVDLTGRRSLADTAAVLQSADAVVAGNTGVAHLAAAVGTPVVSVFAPTVPWARWRPWGVPTIRLGDDTVPCAGCRARSCPEPGQPCTAAVTADEVLGAVDRLTSGRTRAPA